MAAPYVSESGIVFSKETYQTGEKIGFTTDCTGVDSNGWVGVFDPKDRVGDYGTYRADWVYFRDRKDCRFEFAGRTLEGEYEVRVMPPSSDFIMVRQKFSVTKGSGPAPIKLGKAEYKTQEEIAVTAPCSSDADAGSDWIAIYPVGKSSYNYGTQGKDWFYMNQAEKSGSDCSFTFAARDKTGAYEVRQFHGSNYAAYAQVGFEIATTGVRQEPEKVETKDPGVTKPLMISMAKSAYSVGEVVSVAVQCHAKSYPARDPWIGIRKLSAPLNSHPQMGTAARFRKDWYYLKNFQQPGADCVYEFAGRVEPGTYEVRVYRTLESCPCTDNLAGRLRFTVGETKVAGAETTVSAEVMLTEAVSRHKQYDYVRAHSSDCIAIDDENTTFRNQCDFPVSVTFTRKSGYQDSAVQFASAVSAKTKQELTFSYSGTVAWLACHESQGLCQKALSCMRDTHDAGKTVLGYLTAQCSAFEK